MSRKNQVPRTGINYHLRCDEPSISDGLSRVASECHDYHVRNRMLLQKRRDASGHKPKGAIGLLMATNSDRTAELSMAKMHAGRGVE